MRIALLDKVISANLLYLDALQKGLDKDPAYQSDLQRYSDAMLASLYRERYLVDPVQVSEQDVLDFYRKSVDPATELTDDVRRVIEASIREQRIKMKSDTVRERLREGIEVTIDVDALSPGDDLLRSDSTWLPISTTLRLPGATSADFWLRLQRRDRSRVASTRSTRSSMRVSWRIARVQPVWNRIRCTCRGSTSSGKPA